jgi:beta-lactamase superfamily II metal-dependent hydrolase
MAKAKALKKTSRKSPKATRKAPATARPKAAPAGRRAVPNVSPEATQKTTSDSKQSSAGVGNGNIRVRMYRVGFGDFFLLTVPGRNSPAHVLIDCGVHAANIGSIDDCVQDMKKETGGRLALVVLTHYHADHMSGFASNSEDFATFEVGAVWITNRLDPRDAGASKFMAQITSVAQQLQLQLAVRDDPAGVEAHHKVENALGVASEDGGGGSNAKALRFLQSGFKNKPPVYYYQGGDTPTLPNELEGMITAELLGPSPKDSGGEFAASDNKTEQYLAALGDNGVPDATRVQPFDKKKWPAAATDYPASTFEEFDDGLLDRPRKSKRVGSSTSKPQGRIRLAFSQRRLESTLAQMQPDVLAAAADKLDGTLNNQSLVVLFTCNGKKLLFVGDAQWGNWAYWLYGKAVTGSDPGISTRAKEILGSIDFYKVGHHGSTNATPIPAVAALNHNCAAMCSTATGAYGSPARKTEVPRTALMDALEKWNGNRLVRSDWVPYKEEKADPQALQELPELPAGFTTPGDLYIDYNL